MTRPFSQAYKQRMIQRLTGKDAIRARQASQETGISQTTLSAAGLTGAQLSSYLERQGLLLGELEQWRLALGDEGRASMAITKRIHKLERELARKEKALAEAAALLVLKKNLESLWEDEDDDTDENKET